MPRRLHQTLADYLVLAVTPALIMLMVGSLVQFLMNVCYQGNYPERLSFTLMVFVFAAVLIGRISMTEGSEKALLYGVALALVVALALDHYVDYGKSGPGRFANLINWSLMALIWWCSHKLAWDCTLFEDGEEGSGEGLLQSAGLDQVAAEAADAPASPIEPEAVTDRGLAPAAWWQRLVERRRRPHAHGVWVIYFALGALPLFGLGQLFLASTSLERRRHAFGLMCVYVASALGLLLTTSFLGLRRYLRQRGLEMPLAMANSWVGVGSALIVGVLLFAALLPHPNPEYAISELPFQVGSPDQHASENSVGNEGTPDEHGGSGTASKPEANPEKTAQSKSDGADGSGDSNSDKNPPAQEGKNAKATGNSPSKEKSDGESGEKSAENQKNGQKGGEQNGEKTEQKDGADQPDNAKAQSSGEKAKPSDPSQRNGEPAGKPKSDSSPTPKPAETPPAAQPTAPSLPSLGGLGAMLLSLFRWVFYAAVIGLAGWALWNYRQEVAAWLSQMIEQLRQFWAALFGGGRPAAREVEAPPPPSGPPPKSFSDFPDPFAAGFAARMTPDDLVIYSFEALEAWGREQDLARNDDETPLEFARRLGARAQLLSADAERLALLYSQIAYARATLPTNGTEPVRKFWQAIGRVAVPA